MQISVRSPHQTTFVLCPAEPGFPEAVEGADRGGTSRSTDTDHCSRWYPYHHLFADLLQAKLQQSGFERNGQVTKVVVHLPKILGRNKK